MTNPPSRPTFSLFARPSFIEGMARVLDLGSTLQTYNERETPEEADAVSIFNDWLAVGLDIRSATHEYGLRG